MAPPDCYSRAEVAYRWRVRLRPKKSTERPNTVHAAAALRLDDDAPISQLHLGPTSAWASPE
jgi:hypothetical protein